MNPCTPERRKQCVSNSGPHLERLCKECEVREYRPSAWFEHVWYLYRLQQGGYPLKANDLTIEEWMDLGLLKEMMDKKRV